MRWNWIDIFKSNGGLLNSCRHSLDDYRGHGEEPPGLYDQAVPWFRRAIEANRNFPHPHFVLGVALALLGRLDVAGYPRLMGADEAGTVWA
jgi:hypothetical protein